MFDLLREMLSYAFLLRALAVGVMVSLCSALLGVTLVLKKYSMIGDGLSHVGFGAMTVALALNVAPLYVAVPVMIVSAFLLLRLRQSSRFSGDAAVAIISASSIAVGITAASLAGGLNTDVYSYMFGSVLAVTREDVILAFVLCAAILTFFVLGYHRIFAFTFDPDFADASVTHTRPFNMVFALLTAATIVVGMRVMGTMLISGLIVFPAVTAMRLSRSFRGVTVTAGVISVAAFVIGMIASYAFSYIPAGAGVVLANLLFLLLASLVGRLRKTG